MTHLTIRPVQPSDAADLHAMLTHPAIATNLLTLPTITRAETEARLAKPDPHKHRLVAEMNDRPVGYIRLHHNRRPRMAHSGSIGMYVHPDHWRQGIGSALLVAAVDLGEKWLNLRRIELDVYTDNTAAIHLYEKFGFEPEVVKRMATFGYGRYRDELLMARLRQPEAATPAHIPKPAPLPNITLDDIVIRPPQAGDEAGLHATAILPQVAQTIIRLPSTELESLRQRLANPPTGIHTFHAIHNGRAIGWVSLFQDQNPRQMHTAGLGIGIHPDYWGIGLGTKLMETILDFADNWLNLKRVDLEVNTDNPAAIRLYEKLGFVHEGTKRMHVYGNGRWADSHVMARLRE